ncbi:cytochrome P450 2U1-like [Stegodyphus dumicola]|uniref:cytochrome P450 2U1-like n=1 Tax=Stegodyphus dumicola TaxID=202533 RepID=UPI0015A9DBB6|nr:cytochrome P450 2U1-like [Stegodyphus dumicola]
MIFNKESLYMAMSPKTREVTKARDFIWKITNTFIEEHIHSFDPSNVRDYIDVYLYKRNELLKSGKLNETSFSMERLQGNCLNIFFEGIESVSIAATGLLTELSKHLDVQRKVQKEVDNIIGRDRLPSWTDRQNLPYLDATMYELYRVASPFLISTQLSNFEETTIKGYRIPRRSSIIANFWTLNIDPEVYPEPEKFNPGRFLSAEGKRIKSDTPHAFGIGKRACIGESLAQLEIFLICASLLQNFELHPGDSDKTLKLLPR